MVQPAPTPRPTPTRHESTTSPRLVSVEAVSAPPTKSTVSAPSRRTARATAIRSAHGLRCPSCTDAPSLRATPAMSLECAATQMQCHSNIDSASDSTPMLTTSCPNPSNQLLTFWAVKASPSAPSRPTPTPAASQRVRPGNCRVAAATMPTKSAASRDSRNTISAAASIGATRLLGHHGALGGGFVVFSEEGVPAGLQRSDEDRRLRSSWNYLLPVQAVALELFGGAVLVVHDELDALSSRHLDLGRLEAMILDGQGKLGLGCLRPEAEEARGERDSDRGTDKGHQESPPSFTNLNANHCHLQWTEQLSQKKAPRRGRFRRWTGVKPGVTARSERVDEAAQLVAAAGVLELAQRLGFDLADALAGHVELLADFFQRVVRAHFDAEAHAQHFGFAWRQRIEDVLDHVAQTRLHRGLDRCGVGLVFDEVAQVRIVVV